MSATWYCWACDDDHLGNCPHTGTANPPVPGERCDYLLCIGGPACESELGHDGWHRSGRDSWAWSVARKPKEDIWLHGGPA